jgi:hypothetical protein
MKLLPIDGFRVVRDIRMVGKGENYGRIRQFRSRTTSSSVTVQYKPHYPWLRPHSVTTIGDDQAGISADEVELIVAQFSSCRPSMFELAIDFDLDTGVDRAFILRHGVFGKTQWRSDRGGGESLRYGSRRSPKLVRCYLKEALGCYRVELEIHSALLRSLGVNDVRQIYLIASMVYLKHIRFVGVRWKKLRSSLLRKFGGDGRTILAEARRVRDENSLGQSMRFLKGRGVSNPNRFLFPLKINRTVRQALRKWAYNFATLTPELPTR